MALHVPTDPKTGFPKLPEGYFFRVTKWSANLGYPYQIKIRRMILGRWISYAVSYELVASEQMMVQEAWSAHAKWRRKIAARRRNPAVLGDYPPKKWGAS